MAMLPIITDTAFNRLALIDDYISFIWTPRYQSPGDFELCAPVRYAAILIADNFVVRDDDENIGIIEKVNLSVNEDGKEMIVASGRFLSAIIGRRIVAAQTAFNNTYPSAIISTILTENIINPSNSARAIENFILGDFGTLGTQISKQYTGTNILTLVTELCKANKLGFKITRQSGNLVFDLYQGKDRTYSQNENPFMVFSDRYDNLLAADYTENHEKIINAVLVAGEGEGTSRKTTWANNGSPSGISRREYYKDARNVQSNNGAIPLEQYMLQLYGVGKDSLTNYTAAFTGQVDFSGAGYKENVNLGDLCVIENAKWGLSISARLLEVIESTGEDGIYTLTPSFGLE